MMWFQRVQEFLNHEGIEVHSVEELAIVILLIYPAYGPNTGKKAKKQIDKKSEVYRLLKDKGMKIYKSAIT